MKWSSQVFVAVLLFTVLLAGARLAPAMYDAEVGRFITRDPNGYFIRDEANNDQSGARLNTPVRGNGSEAPDTLESDGNAKSIVGKVNDFNLYCYVHDDTLIYTDPTGLATQVCIRPLRALPFTTVLVHCFLIVDGQSYSYDNNGIHADPAPNAWRTQCVTITCPCASDDGIRRKITADQTSGNWGGSNYRFFRHNCCHWVDNVLRGVGCSGVESDFPGYSLPSHPTY